MNLSETLNSNVHKLLFVSLFYSVIVIVTILLLNTELTLLNTAAAYIGRTIEIFFHQLS